MTIPSLEGNWHYQMRGNARIYLLDVADKNKPDAGPIGQLLVERVETKSFDETGQLQKADLQIFHEVVWWWEGELPRVNESFRASYVRYGVTGEETVSLTGRDGLPGTVFLDPESIRGQRIGTYLMNEIVSWAQQWPDAEVQLISLYEGQANDHNRDRRNRFYEQFGLLFEYSDAGHRAGTLQALRVRELNTVDAWEQNIQERDIRDGLREQRRENDRLMLERTGRVFALENLQRELSRAQRYPFVWALTQFWGERRSTISAWALGLLAAGALWLRFKS